MHVSVNVGKRRRFIETDLILHPSLHSKINENK